jgi:type II secretory ATPase GspE/PulE/Tfp pilus assembly ATPase PilB-like protein
MMKADSARLVALFHGAGLLSEDYYAQCSGKYEAPPPKSLWESLNQEASTKSVMESARKLKGLLTRDIDLPFTSKTSGRDTGLRDALTQSVQMSTDEISHVLHAMQPPMAGLLTAIGHSLTHAASPEVAASLGQGPDAYDQLVDRGFLQTRNLSQAVAALDARTVQGNRLACSLALLRRCNALSAEESDAIRHDFFADPAKPVPTLDARLADFIASPPDVPAADVQAVAPAEALRAALPASFVRTNVFLPVASDGNVMEIATPDLFQTGLADTLAFLSGKVVLLTYAPSDALIARIRQLYPLEQQSPAAPPATSAVSAPAPGPQAAQTARPGAPAGVPLRRASDRTIAVAPTAYADEIVDSRSAVELVGAIIDGGVRHGATDIHLEPAGQGMRVRYRIDGKLHTIATVPSEMISSVISRIKVMAMLNVTERRRSQDGHFSLAIDGGAFDFRVSTLPTHIGEKVVIRILDEARVMDKMESLGMEPDQTAIVKKWISRPHGLILVTGPTGSGKSSTLYAAMNTINSESINIVTVEDPVEYRLEGINQVQVDPGADLSFASGLRSILRQDPDVIMVGEVRDPETARIAMRASLTGHLVFSTLHTNTAAGAIASLRQMTIEAYMVVSAVTGIVAQRLLRTLCVECRGKFKPKPEMLRSLGFEPDGFDKRLSRAVGCPACLGSGYKGRTGVYELMPMTRGISEAILEGKSEAELTDLARLEGFGSLLQNARAKMFRGITSPQEVLDALVAADE